MNKKAAKKSSWTVGAGEVAIYFNGNRFCFVGNNVNPVDTSSKNNYVICSAATRAEEWDSEFVFKTKEDLVAFAEALLQASKSL